MNNFWKKLKEESIITGMPILALAPMADVTDVAFRFIIAKYSKLQNQNEIKSIKNAKRCSWHTCRNFVMWTEFVSADGLIMAPKNGREKLLKNLEYSEIERPIVAQFFTSNPKNMEKAAALALSLGFDGVDVNMGCPDKSVEKQGAGAALIKNPSLSKEIILAAQAGVKNKIPISIKTRLGYSKDELETWLPALLETGPAAIIIHARTRKEMSKVPARWERVKRAVEIRNTISSSSPLPFLREGGEGGGVYTLILGNGDLQNVDEAVEKCEKTGADGAMLGRAIFGTPYLFSDPNEYDCSEYDPDKIKKILKIMIEHTLLSERKLKGMKSFFIMKKHYKAYLSHLVSMKADKEWQKQLKKLKLDLMNTNDAPQVINMVDLFIKKLL